MTGAIALGLVFLVACGGVSTSQSPSPAPGNSCGGTTPAPAMFDPGSFPASPGPAGSFFGINTNSLADPGPAALLPVTNWRSLGSGVKWADINTAAGVYDFSRLDKWMAKLNGADIMFTVFATPSWASSHGKNSASPNTCCSYQDQNGPGVCDPPVDLACDGSGKDQVFIDFLTALVQHLGPGAIKYWELWNEPNVDHQWNGNVDCANSGLAHPGEVMLARMAKDLKTTVSRYDPAAQFTTPAATDGDKAGNWLSEYLTATDGGQYADINAFHGYNNNGVCPSDCPQAEAVAEQIDHLNSKLPAAARGKPLFDTEGYWGMGKTGNGTRTSAITDADQQASFVARYYLMQMWKKVARFFWWNWDISDETTFYNKTTKELSAAGYAYAQIVGWTSGGDATVGPCGANPSVKTRWTCTITSPAGAVTVAVWDTAQTCANGVCSTTTVSLASIGKGTAFNAYLDLEGRSTAISNQTVPVGLKAILLTNQ